MVRAAFRDGAQGFGGSGKVSFGKVVPRGRASGECSIYTFI